MADDTGGDLSPRTSNFAQGPYLQLRGLPTAQLPHATASAEELTPLLAALLKEGLDIVHSATPSDAQTPKVPGEDDQKSWRQVGIKSHPASAAKVVVSTRVVDTGVDDDVKKDGEYKENLNGKIVKKGSSKGKGGKAPSQQPSQETWIARYSVHVDASQPKTASWDEFVRHFRDQHPQAETGFTPGVVEFNVPREWASGCANVSVNTGGDMAGEQWDRFTLRLVEMRHKVGRPILKDRVFPVLQMTAHRAERDEFVVVSVPVPDFGVSTDTTTRGEKVLAREKGTLVARYASAERIRKLGEDRDGKIEWAMAVTGDAGGVLPLWLQDRTTPALIWKDVPLFLEWVVKQRGSKE